MTAFQPVIPVGWASSPSIKWDGQSRVLRGTSYQDPAARCPSYQIVFFLAIILENPHEM